MRRRTTRRSSDLSRHRAVGFSYDGSLENRGCGRVTSAPVKTRGVRPGHEYPHRCAMNVFVVGVRCPNEHSAFSPRHSRGDGNSDVGR